MAELESQPLSAEERAELEELRAEKARREAQEEARREREELAALRAERAKAEEAAANVAPAPKPAAAKPAPTAPKPQPKKVARSKSVEPKPSRDEMTFAQRMVPPRSLRARTRSLAWRRLKKSSLSLPSSRLSSLWATRS